MSSLDDLLSRLDSYLNRSGQLAAQLEAALGAMRNGVPLPAEIMAALEECRREYGALVDLARPLLPPEAPDPALSLPELRSLLLVQKHLQTEATISQAVLVLERVLRLTHSDQPDFPSLQGAKEIASRLLEQLREDPAAAVDAARALLDGGHPLAKLISLVTEGSALSETEWEATFQVVAEHFGLSLAAAAVRGRLILPDQPLPPTEPPPPADTVPAHTPPSETEPPPAVEITGEEAQPQGGHTVPLEPVSPEEGQKPDLAELSDVVWQLLHSERTGLAIHLAAAIQRSHPEASVPPSPLLRALALSPHLQRPDGEIAVALERALSSAGLPGDKEDVQHLLLWAATVRPSLLAHSTGAAGLLRTVHLPDGFSNLYELTRTMLRVGERVRGLDPNTLKGVKGRAAWQAEQEQFRQEVEAWWSQAPAMTMLFAAATDVWRVWVRSGGPIYQFLEPVRNTRPERAAEVKTWIERLSEPGGLEKLVDDTDRKQIGRTSGDEIHARALRQMRERVQEAISLARRWLMLIERQAEKPDFVRVQVETLSRELSRLAPKVHRELVAFARSRPSLAHQASAFRALSALEDLKKLFNPETPLPESEPFPRHVLGAELLMAPGLDLTSDWEPEGEAESILTALLEVAGRPADWTGAFDARIRRRDLEGAGRILEYLEAREDPLSKELEATWQRSLDEHRRSLDKVLHETRKEVETALAFGLITETERAEFDARLVDYELSREEIRRFHRAHEDLQGIRNQLAQRKQAKTETAQRALDSLGLDPQSPAHQRIRKAIDSGDILTANEYLERVRAGDSLVGPGPSPRDPLAEFFPARAQEIDAAMDGPSAPEIVRMVKLRQSFAGLPLHRLTRTQADEAGSMLEAWFTVRRERSVREEELRRILVGLGFNPREIMAQQLGESAEAEISVDPINDREICPVPAFGSLAEGRYRILFVWNRPSYDELLTVVGETVQRPQPTFVFHLGRIAENRRREIARLCRERRRSFLVVDDILMVFLAAERGLRLPALFRCTLPFTFAEPYDSTSSLVPPEMFYGRRAELDSIMDLRSGRSFVYGGRQLGKTALLREAARSFHQPKEGRIATWIDLRNEGVGYARGPEEIWDVLFRKFRELGVIPRGHPARQANVSQPAEHFIEAIITWLRAGAGRRILLLLDEADRFFEQDGRKEFVESARLKGLMDETSRRFKVVFAGLHNVLRTTEQSNHPLAHLGDPINIGPLLHNGEWHEARALITRPLESLGHHFASDDLVTRILAQTNYYPSLIQLYCAQLLRQLTSPPAVSREYRTGPPYTIQERHLEEVYQNSDLREAVRRRFHLTLQLDPRYEVIAYLIAHRFITETASSAQGIEASQIKAEALDWWPRGFDKIADQEFSALLDEMVGLGVLRRLELNRFTLRNPNILLLMGTQKQIENVIVKEREAPPVFEPAIFRAARQDTSDPHRHPLTFQQETALREARPGVTILCGVEAAGLNDVATFFKQRVDPGSLVLADGIATKDQLDQHLHAIAEPPAGSRTLLVVPAHLPWDGEWVRTGIDRARSLASQSRPVRLVFVASPSKLWQLMPEADKLGREGAEWVTLLPWHDGFLRHWLEDMGLPVDARGREQIAQTTGNWPLLLMELYQRTRRDHQWEQHLSSLEQALTGSDHIARYWPAFGLSVAEACSHLQLLAEHLNPRGEISSDDIAVLADIASLPAERLEHGRRWAELLGLMRPTARDRWQLDPVVRRLLRG